VLSPPPTASSIAGSELIDDTDDNMKPARGIVTAILVSLLIWGAMPHNSGQERKQTMRAIVALVTATGVLCACSSPYVYQKEVDSFSSSVTTVSNGVTQGLDNLGQDQAAADVAQVINARVGVEIPPECGQENNSGPCRVMTHGRAQGSYLAGRFADVKVPERKVLAALKSYADGLAAVTNAQDRKDYDSAASQLSSSVAGLGTALGGVTGGAGAAAGPVLAAVVTFSTWAIGKGLDAARFDTLRSAVDAVGAPSVDLGGQSAIQVVADKAITPALKAVRSARIDLLARQLNAQQDRINYDLSTAGATHVSLDRYDTPLMELASLVVTLNSVRAIDPAAVGNSLVAAHTDLMNAVNNKSTQFQGLVSSISEFADKAAAVESAFAKKPATSAAKSK
jgi:hypothetical protein